MAVKATKISITETENDFTLTYRNVLNRETVVKISGKRGLLQEMEDCTEESFKELVFDHIIYNADADCWEQNAKDELRKLTDAIATAASNAKNK